MADTAAQQDRSSWAAIAVYVVVVFAASALLNFLGARTGNNVLLAAAQATPLAGVLLVLLAYPRHRAAGLARLRMHRLGNWRWYGWALLIAMAPVAVGYLGAWMLGLVDYSWSSDPSSVGRALLQLTAGYLMLLALPLIWGLAEEIGWRGFLQDRLVDKLGLFWGITGTALTWAVWHYPFIIWGGYYESGSTLINTMLFTVTLIPLSFVFAWLRLRSHSLWPAVVFHAAVNAARTAWQTVFTPHDPSWVYIAGESGVITIFGWTILAWLVWHRCATAGRP